MNDIPRYIGGAFELNLPNLEYNGTDQFAGLSGNLSNSHLLGSARGAWSMLLDYFDWQGGRKLLLPDFLCSRALMPPVFKRKIPYSFYPVNKDLTVDMKVLENFIDDDFSVILFINYFGFTPHESLGWALRKKFPKLVLLLDNVQAFFDIEQEPSESHWAHARYFGFRKFLPLPDGAVLFSSFDLTNTTPYLNEASDISPYLSAAHLRHNFVWDKMDPEIENTVESTYLRLFKKADDEIPEQPTEISSFSRALVHRLPLRSFARKRRENYQYLAKALSGNSGCQLFKEQLDTSEVPLTLPIIVKNQKRDEVRKLMSDSGIHCPIHWPIEFDLRNTFGEGACFLTDHILGLPIDQRYGRMEMDRILGAFQKAIET
jgi:hypothetical protein